VTIDKLSADHPSTIRDDEVERFNRLAATWWNRSGPMRPLHVVNELRLGHVLEQIAKRFGREAGALQGLRIADIGCGAGLMCEPLAARGADDAHPSPPTPGPANDVIDGLTHHVNEPQDLPDLGPPHAVLARAGVSPSKKTRSQNASPFSLSLCLFIFL